MTIEEKLEKFYNVSMEHAGAESHRELEQYEKSLEKLFQEHKEQKQKSLQRSIVTETTESRQLSNMEVAREQMEMKRRVSEKEKELTERLFGEIRGLLAEFKKTEAYRKTLRTQIENACRFAGTEPLRIYIDASDEALLQELVAGLPESCEVCVSQESFGGGTRGVLHSMNILIDNSFQKKIGELMDDFSLIHELA